MNGPSSFARFVREVQTALDDSPEGPSTTDPRFIERLEKELLSAKTPDQIILGILITIETHKKNFMLKSPTSGTPAALKACTSDSKTQRVFGCFFFSFSLL